MIKKALMAVTVCLAICQTSNASLILVINDTSTAFGDVVVIDELGAGSLSSGGGWTSNIADTQMGSAGVVGFSGSIGNFQANVTTGVSKPSIGPNQLDLNSVNVTGGNDGGELQILLIDTDFVDRGLEFLSEIGGTTDHIVDLAFTGVSSTNSEVSFDVSKSHEGFTHAFAFDEYGDNMASGSGAFSMAIGIRVHHTAHDNVSSFNAKFSQVPEPGTLLVWSTLGGLGLISVARRRRRA